MTKAFEMGELILEELPFAHALNPEYVDKVCDSCLELMGSSRLKRCANCKQVHYCDRFCQKKKWKEHKEECWMLKKLADKQRIGPVVLIMLRIFLKLKKGDDGATIMPDGSTRSFYSLMSHEEDIRKSEKDVLDFEGTISHLESVIEMNKENREKLFDIFCKVRINNFGFGNDYHDFASGLYIKASYLDHDCRPNADRSYRNGRMFFRALQDIPDFDHVRVSYVKVLRSTAERRQTLQERYFFLCECDLCARPTPRQQFVDDLKMGGVKCPQCSANVVLKTDGDVVCPDCKFVFDQSITKDTNDLKARMKIGGRSGISLFGGGPTDGLMKEALAKLSLFDLAMVDFVKAYVYELLPVEGGFEAALKMEDVLYEMLPPNDSLLGNYLRNLAQAQMDFGLNMGLSFRLERALRIFMISLGRENRCTKEIQEVIEACRLHRIF